MPAHHSDSSFFGNSAEFRQTTTERFITKSEFNEALNSDFDRAAYFPPHDARELRIVPYMPKDGLQKVIMLAEEWSGEKWAKYEGVLEVMRFKKSISSDSATMALCTTEELDELLDRHYPTSETTDLVDFSENINSIEVPKRENTKQIWNLDEGSITNQSAPEDVVMLKLGAAIIREAIHEGASDVHFTHRKGVLAVLLRVDGELVVHREIESDIGRMLLCALGNQSMGAVIHPEQIARIPQDGKLSVVTKIKGENKQFDIRMAFMPTSIPERSAKLVLRLLKKDGGLGLEDLHFSSKNLSLIKKSIAQPHGLIIATGPTGSGKSTTLHACLENYQKEFGSSRSIITIEDPIEYELEGASQVNVEDRDGKRFADLLRASLRQDPDTIMVGEIRDKVTAETAIRAAETGHLMFSTLHTNDAISSISRLTSWGVHQGDVGSVLMTVIAQRLVRKIVPESWEPREVSVRQIYEQLGVSISGAAAEKDLNQSRTIWVPKQDLPSNKKYYKGQIGIHEVLYFTKDMRDMVRSGESLGKIMKIATEAGFRTMKQDGLQKVYKGLTSLEELAQVVRADSD